MFDLVVHLVNDRWTLLWLPLSAPYCYPALMAALIAIKALLGGWMDQVDGAPKWNLLNGENSDYLRDTQDSPLFTSIFSN